MIDRILHRKKRIQPLYPRISCRDAAWRLRHVEYTSLLDVSCGHGNLLSLLYQQRIARYCDQDLSLMKGETDTLPYPDGSFDVVTCIQSFRQYSWPDQAIAEVYRVLKPGGVFLLSDIGHSGLVKLFYNHFLLRRRQTEDVRVYSRSDIEQRLRTSGFIVEESQKIARLAYTVIGCREA